MCKLLLFIENESNKVDIVNEFTKHLRTMVGLKLLRNTTRLSKTRSSSMTTSLKMT